MPDSAFTLHGQEGNKVQEERNRKARELASLHLAVFGSPHGQKLLEYYTDRYLLKLPVLDANSTEFQAGINQGRANFVREIRQEIERAKEYSE